MAYDREKGQKGRGGMKRTDEQLQELLLRKLSKAGRLRRKQLIEAGIAALGMERGADADLSPGAPLTMMKSRLGMVLTGLIHAGSIREDEAGFLQLERAQDIEFAPAAIRAFIIRTLEERGLLGKQELYRLAEICFGTDRTATKQDDNNWYGRTSGNKMIIFPKEEGLAVGDLRNALVEQGQTWVLKGKLV